MVPDSGCPSSSMILPAITAEGIRRKMRSLRFSPGESVRRAPGSSGVFCLKLLGNKPGAAYFQAIPASLHLFELEVSASVRDRSIPLILIIRFPQSNHGGLNRFSPRKFHDHAPYRSGFLFFLFPCAISRQLFTVV